MKTYDFNSGAELLALAANEKLPISALMLRREMYISEKTEEELRAEMAQSLAAMRASIKNGLENAQATMGGFSGAEAESLECFAKKALMGERMAHITAAAMAVVEVNASMGRIVAAPTAGASGILPAALIVGGKYKKWNDDALVNGLFTAGAIGALIAENATVSGAAGGCQAETGTAAAMAAAALTELSGGTPEQALTAAAIALKLILGLVCDPVAGLVECPCIKRNALGAMNAVLSSDMALSGIKSLIPFDEVVAAMLSVGRLMSHDLRETAKGGLAATPTARELSKKLGLSQSTS